MTAHMWSDVRYLHSINIVVSANHPIESMLPVHCHKWIAIIIVEKKYGMTVNYFFHLRWLPVLNNGLEHLCHILCDWQYSCSGIRFCVFYDIPHIRCSLQLMVDIHSSVLKINILQRQSTKFRYSHSRIKKYVHHFIVFTVHHIVMHKL